MRKHYRKKQMLHQTPAKNEKRPSSPSTGHHARQFPDKPCVKRAYKDNWATVHGSAAKQEERSWFHGLTAGANRWPNADPLALFPHRFP